MNSHRRIDPPAALVLPEGELRQLAPARLKPKRPWRVAVEVGAVWITWPDCGDDVFVRAGEQVDVPAGRRALVQVEPRLQRGAAVLRVTMPPPPAAGAAQATVSRFAASSPHSRVACFKSSSHAA